MRDIMLALTFGVLCAVAGAVLARTSNVRGWHYDDIAAAVVLYGLCGYWGYALAVAVIARFGVSR